MKEIITTNRLIADFKALGLKTGDLVNVKISIKSIGQVKGGPKSVIEALKTVVGNEGTIVSESFVNMYPVWNLKFNKSNSKYLSTEKTPTYAGAIASTMINYPDAYRSSHPIHKFSAIGKLAKQLTENHTINSEAYGVLAEMIKLNGKNLRVGGIDKVVGVGTTHVAIEHTNIKARTPFFGVNYIDSKNHIKCFMMNWAAGACENAFNSLLPLHKKEGSFIGEGYVGNAEAILSDMAKTYHLEKKLIFKSISNITCNDPTCVSCRLNWEKSEKRYIKTALSVIKNKQPGKIKSILIRPFRHYKP